jgi:hypothetical protein
MAGSSELETANGPASPIVWRDAKTWVPEIDTWIQPFLEPNAIDRLKSTQRDDLYRDDHLWLEEVLADELSYEVEHVVQELSDYLESRTIKVYHGCRVADVGVYLKEGLKINDPEACKAVVRKIVSEEPELEWMLPTLEHRLANFPHSHRDRGTLFLGLDDRLLVEDCCEYALYGSEWLRAFFPSSARHILRRRGIPTIIIFNIPINLTTSGDRKELSRALLQEWTCLKAYSRYKPRFINFSFLLRENIPGAMIVDHYHPAGLVDVYQENKKVKTVVTRCPSCP